MAHVLTCNRFVNNAGKKDSNIEVDRENEHRNKTVKQETRPGVGVICRASSVKGILLWCFPEMDLRETYRQRVTVFLKAIHGKKIQKILHLINVIS